MEEVGLTQKQDAEKKRVAGKEKEEQREAREKNKEEQSKARAKEKRERRNQAKAERAQTDSASTPSSSSTPADLSQELPIAGALDAATLAHREANKSGFIEWAAEHCARLRQQEEERIQEAQCEIEEID